MQFPAQKPSMAPHSKGKHPSRTLGHPSSGPNYPSCFTCPHLLPQTHAPVYRNSDALWLLSRVPRTYVHCLFCTSSTTEAQHPTSENSPVPPPSAPIQSRPHCLPSVFHSTLYHRWPSPPLPLCRLQLTGCSLVSLG